MNKDEIQKEIEKVQKQLQELKEKLANVKSLSDPVAREKIDDVADDYQEALRNAGLNDISYAFGQIVAAGEYKNRAIFLTNNYGCRYWKWVVRYDRDTNSEVLERVHKLTYAIID